MNLYAARGPRRAGQVTGDVLLVLWVVLWAYVGTTVHDAVSSLGTVGEQVEAGGSGLAGRLTQAGEAVASVPLAGDALRSPFDQAGGAAQALADAGRMQQEAADMLGQLLGWSVALVPITLLVLLWLPRRVAFARRASAARRHLDTSADLDLFALRAIAAQPIHRVAGVSADPVADWRRGDPDVVRRLAALELRDLGLRLPDSR
jgi:hypothetical protein